MPKVSLNTAETKESLLYSWLSGVLYSKTLTQQMIADELGITQQAVSYKIKNGAFSVRDWITIFEMVDSGEALSKLINLMRGIK